MDELARPFLIVLQIGFRSDDTQFVALVDRFAGRTTSASLISQPWGPRRNAAPDFKKLTIKAAVCSLLFRWALSSTSICCLR